MPIQGKGNSNDKAALAEIFKGQVETDEAEAEGDEGVEVAVPEDSTNYHNVIQYCVLFSLKNTAGEEATVLETEIRLVEGIDGTINLDSF